MPTDVQVMVEPAAPTGGYGGSEDLVDAGSRNNAILKASFPNSPVMWSDDADVILTDEGLTNGYLGMLQEGSNVHRGYLFPEGVDMNYGEAPDIAVPDGRTATGEPFNGAAGAPILASVIDGLPWPVPTPVNSISTTEDGDGPISVGATPNFQLEYLGPAIVQKSINYGSGPESPENPSDQTVGTQDFTALVKGSSS